MHAIERLPLKAITNKINNYIFVVNKYYLYMLYFAHRY